MDAMMILGEYIFGLNTAAFQELNRNTTWRWGSQDVFNGPQALQFTGWGEDTITLPGVIFPEYWGGTGQVDALRELADAGEAQTLIDGRGNVLGEWVITSVQERQSTFAQAGAPRRQEFTVSLQKYSADGVGTSVAASAQELTADTPAGSAVIAAPGTVSGLQAVVSSATAAASTAISGLQAARDSMNGAVQAVSGAIGGALGAARAIESAARDAKAAVGALSGVTSYTTALSAVRGLVDATGSAVRASTFAAASLQQVSGATGALVEVNRLAVTATSLNGQLETVLEGFR